MDINVDALRRDLEEFYGSAAFGGFPAALVDLAQVENASPQQLVELSRRAGLDLTDYEA